MHRAEALWPHAKGTLLVEGKEEQRGIVILAMVVARAKDGDDVAAVREAHPLRHVLVRAHDELKPLARAEARRDGFRTQKKQKNR